MTRTPIHIKRKPVKALTKRKVVKHGGWFLFDKPKGEEPPRYKLDKNERVLWCPWCGCWRLFTRREDKDNDVLYCTGDGWSNTNEFYVRKVNNLMWEGVSTQFIKEYGKYALPRRG